MEIMKAAFINDNAISILFNDNKIGIVDMDTFLSLPPYYKLLEPSIFKLLDYDKERLFWGDSDKPIIDIHIDQLIEGVVWINE